MMIEKKKTGYIVHGEKNVEILLYVQLLSKTVSPRVTDIPIESS